LDCIWLLGTVALITDFEVPDSKFTVYFFIFNLKLNFIEIKST